MKKIYCDICGNLIPHDSVSHRLILPTWNKISRASELKEYPDVCNSCVEDIAVFVAQMLSLAADTKKMREAESSAPEWHPASDCPPADGRYLVADSRLSVSGRPHVSIAMYSRDDDEWATNALIHPEDIICWTDIPETPERFFKEKEDLIENEKQ